MTDRAPGAPPESPTRLPLLDDEIAATLQAERARLLAEAGLSEGPVEHFRRPVEARFSRAERGQVTLWFGGLTIRHERLILAGLEGLGYRAGIVPTPSKPDFQAGKEFGNNGQCNPTYFTVGALVNHLRRLRDEDGIPLDTILRDHVFITAGACGPCRFGMYEAEYRLALRNAGFDGFRVLLFQQKGGYDQTAQDAGIDYNLNFFLTLLNSFVIGDLLNEVAYAIRPYETVPGQTDAVLARCVERCAQALREKDYDTIHSGAIAAMLAAVTPVNDADTAARFLDQLSGTHYTDALRDCRAMLDEIEVDLLRPRPVCKVTGEFWAQTTEGDGNFRMFSFLESEGADVLVEPVATWIAYMLHQAMTLTKDRRGLMSEAPGAGLFAEFFARMGGELAFRGKMYSLKLAQRALTREYDRFREALGGTAHALVNQLELQRVGHPYYNSRAGGGEGHLEVAKNIYYANKDLCHMVLSLKPFGCMPSTQSDGAQAAVTSHFKDMIYIPIETSGEGDVNAHSRVQMALGEAKAKAKEEFRRAVSSTGYTLAELGSYVAGHRQLHRPLQHVPQVAGVVGRAANFARYVGGLMRAGNVRPISTSTSTNERQTA